MTAAVKVKDTIPETGMLDVTYVNETRLRDCREEDFNKTNMVPSFNDLSTYKNLYCPDSYENVTLATQRMKAYEQAFSWRIELCDPKNNEGIKCVTDEKELNDFLDLV